MIILIILLAFATMLSMSVMDIYGSKQKGTRQIVKFAIKLMPLQAISYVGMIMVFVYGFQALGEQYWLVALSMIVASYVSNLAAAYSILKQVPTKGQLLGLVLTFLGALIAILWV
jgi:hypothetical protein